MVFDDGVDRYYEEASEQPTHHADYFDCVAKRKKYYAKRKD